MVKSLLIMTWYLGSALCLYCQRRENVVLFDRIDRIFRIFFDRIDKIYRIESSFILKILSHYGVQSWVYYGNPVASPPSGEPSAPKTPNGLGPVFTA